MDWAAQNGNSARPETADRLRCPRA